MEIASLVMILATCILILVITNVIQLTRNIKLNEKFSKLTGDFNNLSAKFEEMSTKFEENKSKRETDELVDLIGSRATMSYSLCYKDKDNFSVVYEVEILNLSKEKAKVKVLDYSSTDSIANEPSKRSGILAFMDNKWVSREDLSIIVDESSKRDAKLRSLGID